MSVSSTTANPRVRESAEQFANYRTNAKPRPDESAGQAGQASGGARTGQTGHGGSTASQPSHAASGGFGTGRILNITA